MEQSTEERFVRSFIQKNRQDRLLHELTSPKKRYSGISRFCHSAVDLLDPRKIRMEGEDLDRSAEFLDFVKKHDEPCFIMSPDSFVDGQWLPFAEAVEQAVFCPDAAVIIGSGFAVVFGEPMKGGRGKYLLTDQDKKTSR